MIKTNIKMQVTPEQSAKVQQICFDNNIYWRDTGNTLEKTIKFICLLTTGIYTFHNSTIFNAKRFKEIDPELFIATNGSCEIANPLATLDVDLMESTHTESHSIPTTDQFAKYGFQTPDFQCKLYDKLDAYILGAYFNHNKQKWTMCRWGFDGHNKQGSYNYALKPLVINKPWYETCKFPILVTDTRTQVILILQDMGEYYKANARPLTDDEIEALKQGF